MEEMVNDSLNNNIGLDSFIISNKDNIKPILCKSIVKLPKEEIERIKNELLTETKLHEAADNS